MSFVDLSTILEGELNPDYTPKTGAPVARSKTITDSVMSIFNKKRKENFSPDRFENVDTFNAFVLRVEFVKGGLVLGSSPISEPQKPIEEQNEKEKQSGSPTKVQYTAPDHDTLLLTCMIPELHAHLPNPFQARTVRDFTNISAGFYPRYQYPVSELKSPLDVGVPIASIVEVKFKDSNRTSGQVMDIIKKASNNIIQQLINHNNSPRDAFKTNASATSVGDGSLSVGNLATEYSNAGFPLDENQLLSQLTALTPDFVAVTSKKGYRGKVMHEGEQISGGKEREHRGIDIDAPAGSPINLLQSGTVESIRFNEGGYGHYVTIKHPDGSRSLYAHMQEKPPLEVGQTLGVGDTVGKVGSTGSSSGAHLHWEVTLPDGTTRMDPFHYLSQKQQQ